MTRNLGQYLSSVQLNWTNYTMPNMIFLKVYIILHLYTATLLNLFCQAQPKPQSSWAEWLYFQLIQPPTHPGKFILQPVSILALSQPNPQLSLAQCSSSLSFAEYTELALYSINIASHSHQGKFISQQQLT